VSLQVKQHRRTFLQGFNDGPFSPNCLMRGALITKQYQLINWQHARFAVIVLYCTSNYFAFVKNATFLPTKYGDNNYSLTHLLQNPMR